MAKDKYDFIQDILESKRLNQTQKERVLKLATQEFSKDSLTKGEMEKRLKAVEQKLALIPSNKTDEGSENNEKDSTKSSLPKYFNPSHLYNFLLAYNQNSILKSTCHEIDTNELDNINKYCKTEEYNFQKHLEKILSAFKELEKLPAPNSLKALIRGYLIGKDYNGGELKGGWSTTKIKINWSHESLKKWAEANKSLPPNATISIFRSKKKKAFEFDELTSMLSGKKIQNFRELVLYFKSLFHIRFDNSLYDIINTTNKNKGWDTEIDFEINEGTLPKNIELFTDVDKLIQAYNKLIELIIKNHFNDAKPKVKLSFYELGTNVFLSIHHTNNVYNKTIQNTTERIGQDYANLIDNQLHGMCNLYLKADFGREGYAEINLWNGKERTAKSEGLENFSGGVEHILEFCKK